MRRTGEAWERMRLLPEPARRSAWSQERGLTGSCDGELDGRVGCARCFHVSEILVFLCKVSMRRTGEAFERRRRLPEPALSSAWSQERGLAGSCDGELDGRVGCGRCFHGSEIFACWRKGRGGGSRSGNKDGFEICVGLRENDVANGGSLVLMMCGARRMIVASGTLPSFVVCGCVRCGAMAAASSNFKVEDR